MAGDIMDEMFKTLIDLVGWIFKKLFQFAWWIISSIFKLLWGLISKNKGSSDNSQRTGIDYDGVNQLYIDAKYAVDNFDIENCSSNSDIADKITDMIVLLCDKIVTNGYLSVERKCELLTLFSEKLLQQGVKTKYYNMTFVKIIDRSYKILEGIVPSPLLLQEHDTFKRELAQNNVRAFTTYFGEIFGISGLLGSPNGKFNMNHSIFAKYNFPEYRIDDRMHTKEEIDEEQKELIHEENEEPEREQAHTYEHEKKETRHYEPARTHPYPKPSNYLGLAIFSILMFFPIGLVAIYHSLQVNSRYKAGNYDGAIEASKKVIYWAIGGILLFILFGIIGNCSGRDNSDKNKKENTQIVNEPTTNYYTTSSLNVRITPSSGGRIIGKLREKEEIYVYQERITNEFAKIKYKGDVAYVSNQYIQKKGVATPAVVTNTEKINIPKTNSIIAISNAYNEYSAYENKKNISKKEQDQLRINDIFCLSNKESRVHIIKGKTILNKNFGRLETILSVVDDFATFEYLVSYDKNGNYVDCIEIGTIRYYASDRGSSIIEGDKVFYRSEWIEPNSEEGTVYIDYQITPQLTFIQIDTREDRRIISSD
jgi:hypothetical protein